MNKRRFYCTLAVAAIAAIIAGGGTAMAQDPENSTTDQTSKFIQRFDRDADGRLSAEEFPTRFQVLDTNGDGFIDSAEAPGPHGRGKRRGGRMFARFDADGDGQLSKEEFPGPEDRFAEMDANGNGFLTKTELAAGKRRGGPGRDDKDGDGRVSKEEFSGPAEMFEQLDTNDDGYIDRSESPFCRRWGGDDTVEQ